MNYYQQEHVALYMNKQSVNQVISLLNTLDSDVYTDPRKIKNHDIIVDPRKIREHILPHYRNFNYKSNEIIYNILESRINDFIFLNLRNQKALNTFTPENLFLDLKQVQIINGLGRLRNKDFEDKIVINFTTTIDRNGKIRNTDILRDTILKSCLTRSFYDKKINRAWINDNVSRSLALFYSSAVSSLLFKKLNLDFIKSKIIKLIFFHYYYSLIMGKKDLELNRTIIDDIKIDQYVYLDILDFMKDNISGDMTFYKTVSSLNKISFLQLQKSITPNEIMVTSSNWANKNSILSYSVHTYPPNFLYLLYKFNSGSRSPLFFMYKQLNMDKDINSILNDINSRDL